MRYYNKKSNIRKDLIEKELFKDRKYSYIKLSNKFISRLYSHYNMTEFTEHWYDWHESQFANKYSFKEELPSYDELKEDTWEAWEDKFNQLIIEHPEYHDEYENLRIQFNNWIDMIGPGIWNMTQKRCNDYTRNLIKKKYRDIPEKGKRVYVSHNKDLVHIYFYMRDIDNCDYHFIFEPKNT